MSVVARFGAFAARPIVLFVSLALVVVFSYAMNASGLPTSGTEFARLAQGPVFDFRSSGYDAHELAEALMRAGEPGRRIYGYFMVLDIPFPAIYATFWAGVFHRAVGDRTDAWRGLVLLPVLVALLDYGENLGIAVGFFTYPALAPRAVTLASGCTQAKLVATPALLLVAMALLVRWIVLRLLARSRARG
ncbi:MAG: hypothetical protein JST00_34865 [Deltaproteobacteria bacterium]|nr:hypothetical protein [Deltaproteobacteria bacterium]